MTDATDAIRLHQEVVAEGRHLIQQLGMRDVASGEGRLATEMDNRPDISNFRGAMQGGIVATLIDVTAGRLAMSLVADGHGTATSDMTLHYLAPIIVGPARAESRVIRQGRRSIVTSTEVWDAGRERLAAVATISFAVLEPR